MRFETAMYPMDDQLVGYLLHALDEKERRQVESYLHSSPDARRKLETLRTALTPLEADRASPLPPPGLAERTLARVIAAPRRRLRTAPRISGELGFNPSRWRRSDLLVASIAGLIFLGMAWAWIGKTRRQEPQTACQNNLRRFHHALVQYANQRSDNSFPRVESSGPRGFAGVYLPALIDAGTMTLADVPICPAHSGWTPAPEMQRLADLEKCYKNARDQFDRLVA